MSWVVCLYLRISKRLMIFLRISWTVLLKLRLLMNNFVPSVRVAFCVDICYNEFDKQEFVGVCNEPNRINSQERYFTNI